MLNEFQRMGRILSQLGLISSHAGNLSVRLGDRIVITRRGSMLGDLGPDDLIETGLLANDSGVTLASTEIVVHRAIYQQTSALAIVHAHPPYAVTLSLVRDTIIPVDSEGSYLLHKVPVVESVETTGSPKAAEEISRALKNYRTVILRGHGSFSIGPVLEDALALATALEASAKIIYLLEGIKEEGKEYRKFSDDYDRW